MRGLLLLALLWTPVLAAADPLERLVAVAEAYFPKMPPVIVARDIAGLCGGGGDSNSSVQYCARSNRILRVPDLAARAGSTAAAGYMLAHLYGHAAQVQHGVADIALARILTDRAREAAYRGMVTGQVECIAGVLHGFAFGRGAGDPETWFRDEPFTGAHWGAAPLRNGPRVSIGLAARAAWFRRGRDAGDVAACDAGVFSAELLVKAAARARFTPP